MKRKGRREEATVQEEVCSLIRNHLRSLFLHAAIKSELGHHLAWACCWVKGSILQQLGGASYLVGKENNVIEGLE